MVFFFFPFFFVSFQWKKLLLPQHLANVCYFSILPVQRMKRTHWVRAWPSCKCQSLWAHAFLNSCVSCGPAQHHLNREQKHIKLQFHFQYNIKKISEVSEVKGKYYNKCNNSLLYGASSCCAAASKVSWILGLSNHSWSWMRLIWIRIV